MQRRFARSLGVRLAAILVMTPVGVGAATPPPSGQIFVLDSCDHRIVRINDVTGSGWATFGSFGSGVNQFRWPHGIFVNPAGQIFVADTGSNRWQDPKDNQRIVRINDMTGAGWTTFGSHGSGVNQFMSPDDIFVNPAGQIFVADSDNNRIVRINDMTGAGWTTFGRSGRGVNQFNGPNSIFVSAAGQIFVVDAGNSRIVRISDITGAGWTTFGSLGTGVNQFLQLFDIFVTPVGQIYTVDFRAARIVRINDMTGAGWITLSGFNGPAGIFVNSGGQIFCWGHPSHRAHQRHDRSGLDYPG